MNWKVRGSPPRVRGTGQLDIPRFHSAGITPACAGNSMNTAHVALTTRDHPRVCGEQVFIIMRIAPRVGSPPRVRGTAPPWK